MSLFISHAAGDGARYTADLAVALQRLDLRCWYAPRDEIPGVPFTEQLVEAIERSEGVILLITPKINHSRHVALEIETALSNGKLIAPVVVRKTEPNRRIAYCLGSNHRIPWTDAKSVAKALSLTFSRGEAVETPVATPASRIRNFDHVAAVANKARRQREEG